MSLNSIDRKRIILELLDKEEKVKTVNLAKELNVSSESIRRYLDELEGEKKLKKVYGGAIKISTELEEPEHIERNTKNINEKNKIAKLAATLVEDDDCIVLDEGTTCLQMISYIVDKNNLTVVTSSCTALAELISYKNRDIFNGEIIFIGGKINTKHQRSSGQIAIEVMRNIFVNKAFISVEGVINTFGISSADLNKALLSREYIKNSNESIVLCDSSKVGVISTHKISEIRDVNRIISDIEPPLKWKEEIIAKNTEWMKAE